MGSAISLSNESYTVVGVLGRDFFTDPAADVWVPFQLDPNSTNLGHYFVVAGRLKPGVTVTQANAALKLAADQFRRQHPEDLDPKDSFGVQPLRDSMVAGARTSLLILLGAVSFVLLIACANVANLLLVRAAGRKREFAIRAALGASRMRIMRQLLTESVVLALSGGILGLALGYLGVRALLSVSPAGLPRVGEHGAAVSLDWRVVAFTLGVSLLTGILFGLFPAIGASRLDLEHHAQRGQQPVGDWIPPGQSALTFGHQRGFAGPRAARRRCASNTHLHRASPSCSPASTPRNVLTLEMSLTGDRFQKTAGVAQVARDGRERLNAIPGVEASAFTCCVPLSGGYGLPFNIIGRPLTGKSLWTRRHGLDERLPWISFSSSRFSFSAVTRLCASRTTAPLPPWSSSTRLS